MPQALLGPLSTGLLVGVLLVVAVLGLGLATGRWRVVPVLSGSMRPAFDAGSAVLVVSAPARSVRTGDVIVYHPPGEDRWRIVHRVVEVVEPGPPPVVRTRGDANNAADPWVALLEGDSIWRVRASLPLIGHLLAPLERPSIRYSALLLVMLGLLVPGLRAIWRQPDEAQRTRSWTTTLAVWGPSGWERPPSRTCPSSGGIRGSGERAAAEIVSDLQAPASSVG